MKKVKYNHYDNHNDDEEQESFFFFIISASSVGIRKAEGGGLVFYTGPAN